MRLVVVLPLRRLRVGEAFALRDWPLHVTVAPTFVIGGTAGLDVVAAAIEGPISRCAGLVLVAGQDEGFGRSGAIPVTVIQPAAELDALHHLLVAALSAVGAVFDDPEFVGPGYRAHVTLRKGDRLHAEDVLQPSQAIVVDMEPQGDARLRRVVWARDLGGTLEP